MPWTLTETEQDVPGASEAPDKLTDDDPAVAVAVPVQLPLKPDGVATTKPAGRLSVKLMPLSGRFVLLFEIVNVRLAVPFRGIVAAPNCLVMLGGLMTVRLAEDVDCVPVPAVVELIVTELL